MTIMVDPYWDATNILVPLFDFVDWYEYLFWYSWNQDNYDAKPDGYLGWAPCMSIEQILLGVVGCSSDKCGVFVDFYWIIFGHD